MKAGRKTLPTAIKILRGTLAKSRIVKNEATAPMVISFLDPPAILDKWAAETWNKVIPELMTMGILALIDMELVTAYCIEMGRYKEANDKIKNNGPITKAPSGYPMIHPWYTVARQSLKAALEIGCNFGMTATSRSRISVPRKSQTERMAALKKDD